MGKKKPTDVGFNSNPGQMPEALQQVAASNSKAVEEIVAKPKRFMVTLAAPTPITFNSVEIEAVTPDEAKAKFCAMNGIDGSTQPWTVTEV